MKVTVNVKPYHIKYGERGSPGSCPIAYAANRLLKPGYRAYVDLNVLMILDEDDYIKASINLPPHAGEFIDEFDEGDRVSPISFTVDIPERFLR